MQTITLNIGLNTNTGERLAPHKALAQLFTSFQSVTDTRVADSPNGDEQVLIATIQDPCSDRTIRACIKSLSERLEQDCVAVLWPDGSGELIGPKAEEWGRFQGAYFVTIHGTTLEQRLEQLNHC